MGDTHEGYDQAGGLTAHKGLLENCPAPECQDRVAEEMPRREPDWLDREPRPDAYEWTVHSPLEAAGTALWNVQRFDQTLSVYTALDAAKAHGSHVVRAHYQDAMDRRRVPESHRAVDWRVHCCGHLYGPGRFDHTAYPAVHADGCPRPESRVLVLRPFWAATGTSARTGHVSTDWEIWQGTAYDRFDPSAVFA